MSLLIRLGRSTHIPNVAAAFSTSNLKNYDWFFNGHRMPDKNLFTFYPFFLNMAEQRVLLKSSLKKLDVMDTHRARKRRRSFIGSHPTMANLPATESINSLFLPDEVYEFIEVNRDTASWERDSLKLNLQGHYDGVIKNFRETHLTSWPEEDYPALLPILKRLNTLIPEDETQTHLLHLSTLGEILPHVDNLEASGSWIMGVSLGCPRVMRLENSEDKDDSFDVLLPSGSVYIQR